MPPCQGGDGGSTPPTRSKKNTPKFGVFFFDKKSINVKLNAIMKTIYLVRHGHVENPDNIFYGSDAPLSAIGAKEMLAVANDIKTAGCSPEIIISSPYLRARESAEVIAQALGNKEVEFDKRLIEWQVGDWIGKPLEEFRKFVGYYNDPFIPNLKGLETYSEMADRALEVINDMKKRLSGNSCGIIVSHREPLASAVLRLLNKPDTKMRKIDFPKASAWKIVYQNDELISVEKAIDRASEETKKDII